MKLLIEVLVIALIMFNLAYFGGKKIDSICVEGRLSQAQAEAINELPWEKCPGYRRAANGKCEADLNDRIIARECSEFGRKVAFRDVL